MDVECGLDATAPFSIRPNRIAFLTAHLGCLHVGIYEDFLILCDYIAPSLDCRWAPSLPRNMSEKAGYFKVGEDGLVKSGKFGIAGAADFSASKNKVLRAAKCFRNNVFDTGVLIRGSTPNTARHNGTPSDSGQAERGHFTFRPRPDLFLVGSTNS